MKRAAFAAGLALASALFTGCATDTVESPGTKPGEPLAMPLAAVSPEVSVFSPLVDHELDVAEGGSVSGAVHTLTLRGYENVSVHDVAGAALAQPEWDMHSVVGILLTEATAVVTVG